MQYLADTNVLLWYIQGDNRLPGRILSIMDDPSREIFVSAASIWEISIKYSLKQIELFPDISSFLNKYVLNDDYRILPVTASHALHVATLPYHHRDPFDRLIYSQSVVENLEFLYTDSVFNKYRAS
jgi:PIN domain nuclease of toxin-antitoxin system